jgi:hypothetical protein
MTAAKRPDQTVQHRDALTSRTCYRSATSTSTLLRSRPATRGNRASRAAIAFAVSAGLEPAIGLATRYRPPLSPGRS